MKSKFFVTMLGAFAVAALAAMPAYATTTCTPTGYVRDSINLTAAVVNPTGVVSGTIDATGCDIGVYYGANENGAVDGATISGAKYFGVVVNGDEGPTSVDVTNSTIKEIGDSPFDGSQHGVGIYYRACADAASSATGTISGNDVYAYQKGGIVASCSGTSVQIRDNIVKGLGEVPYIAQNGIEVGYGATASVMRNTVSDNQYTGSSTFSSGILVVGGSSWCDVFNLCPSPDTTDTQIMDNQLTDNDSGVVVQDFDGLSFGIPTSHTNIKVVNNSVSDDDCSNGAYQAGISDVGNNDKLIHNTVSGVGYDPDQCTTPAYGTYTIDNSYTTGAKIHANVMPQ